jgi:hypothetical protein
MHKKPRAGDFIIRPDSGDLSSRERVRNQLEEVSMRHMISAFALVLLSTAAFAADSPGSAAVTTGPDEVDATVDLTAGSVAAGIGYVWGGGELIYQGQKRKFKISGLSVVDVGAAHITASGVVYHLKNVSDFNGNYTAVTAGLTIGGGASAALLKNEHGVVIKLISTTSGLRFNLAAAGIGLKLTD